MPPLATKLTMRNFFKKKVNSPMEEVVEEKMEESKPVSVDPNACLNCEGRGLVMADSRVCSDCNGSRVK